MALVISNFPIVVRTVAAVLGKSYQVVGTTWSDYAEELNLRGDLVIIDVTTVSLNAALPELMCVLPEARLVVCSLHQNEVTVYWLGDDGLTREAQLPSLFSLAA